MVSAKFLSHPTLADFSHLLKPDAKQGIQGKIHIDLDKGIAQADTPEEAAQLPAILTGMATAEQMEAAAGRQGMENHEGTRL